jgi:hypothetical protein
MQPEIEFTDDQIDSVWLKVFSADEVPDVLTRKMKFDACLAELSPEGLREELRQT